MSCVACAMAAQRARAGAQEAAASAGRVRRPRAARRLPTLRRRVARAAGEASLKNDPSLSLGGRPLVTLRGVSKSHDGERSLWEVRKLSDFDVLASAWDIC